MDGEKKRRSVIIPCYSKEENVQPFYEAVRDVIEKNCGQYDYEILFINNHSRNRTQEIIRAICQKDRHVKAIFVKRWEEGYQIVHGVKTSSKESKLMYSLRSFYYRMIKKYSSVEQIEHFTGFGLYDRSFIEAMRELKDPTPFLRGIVAELGGKRKEIPYEQPLCRAGKTHHNGYSLYAAAMLSFTSYTKIGLRMATFIGLGVAFFRLLVAFVYLILKLCNWDNFVAGTAPIVVGMFFLGTVQLIFLGINGEYIPSINQRIMNRPLVVEEERINFDEPAPASGGAADVTQA